MKTLIKKLTLTAAAVGWLFTTQAQVSGGIAGGVSTGTVEINNAAATGDLRGTDVRGFEAGLYGKIQLGNFYVRPHVLYGYQKGQVSWQRNDLNSDYHTHNFQIPVYIGFNILGPVAIEAAPVYNYAFNASETYNGIIVRTGRSGLGYRAGAAVDFGKIIINASYEGMTYRASGDRVKLSQPGRFIAGLAIRVGGGVNQYGNRNTDRRNYKPQNRDY